MGLHTYGTMAVDWEERVRFDRLREERLARISGLLAESSMGALLTGLLNAWVFLLAAGADRSG